MSSTTPILIGFLIIGNEILSGQTREKNLALLATLLKPQGLRVAEVRVVRDEEAEIIAAVNALRARYDYVFTSGGIGPTHDDITAASIAAAFGEPLVENERAVEILQSYFDGRGLELTAARRRMANMPQSAVVVESKFPGAPGFRVGNVFVCAGVPDIFELMAAAALKFLPQQAAIITHSVLVQAGESHFADGLAAIAQKASDVEIGSYPKPQHCQITFSGTDGEQVSQARCEFIIYLQDNDIMHHPED